MTPYHHGEHPVRRDARVFSNMLLLFRSSLHSQASILSNNLVSIAHLLDEHRDTLASMVAYPTPLFPGRTEANMLSQLVRTKLEPRGEEWVARGRRVGDRAENPPVDTGATGEQGKPLTGAQLRELWHWAPIAANEEARRRDWGGEYTLEEEEMGLENVVTGLKRKLVDEDEEESDEEGPGNGDEMKVVGVHTKPGGAGVEFDISKEGKNGGVAPAQKAMALDSVFRFMMTGQAPR